MAFDVSQNPYNDEFDINKKWEMLLFNPNRPLMQRELNESQSVINNQISLLGNSVFTEGSILSGMSLVADGTDNGGNSGSNSDANPNFISLASITSNNSKIDTSTYKTGGTIGVSTTATVSSDYPGVQFQIANSGETSFVLSFTIKRDSGTLYKFYGQYDSSLTVSSYTIDGASVKNSFGDSSSTLLVDSQGNQINLNDGNAHTVVVAFTNAKSGPYSITLIANPGYNAIQSGNVNFTISALKAEKGDTPTPWILAQGDEDINTGDQRNQKFTVYSGYVFLNGMVRKFDQQDINVTGVGTEKIGVTLSESVLTAAEDPSLVDHTSGAASQWQQGADRLIYTINLTYNDPNSATIYTLIDGKVDTSSSTNNSSTQLKDILAKRTNDESGSYQVSGYNLWSEKDKLDSSVIDLVIDKGTAYVKGYQIIKTTANRVKVPKSTGTSNIADEVLTYSLTNFAGTVSNQPVKEINQVSGNVAVSSEAVTRGANLATNDTLDNTAISISKVYSTDSSGNEVDYVAGTDYALVNGNQLQWTGSHVPNAGSTYYVSYLYEKVFQENVDYQVNTINSGALAVTSIDFDSMSGLKPADKSQVHVNYDYFLARVDTVTLDSNGEFNLVSGKEDKLSQIKSAAYIDPNTLILGYVTVYPNSDTATTQSKTISRIPFSGLQDLVTRVSNLESNAQNQSILNNATSAQDPTTINSVFGDGFTDLSMADYSNKAFTARMNLNAGQITTDDKVSSELKLIEDTANSSVHLYEDVLTPNFTESPIISQVTATGVININPFDSYQNIGYISIDPATDSWIDEKKTTVNNDSQGADTGSGSSKTKVEDGTTSTTTSADTTIEYMRQRVINFSATNLMPLNDNLVLTVDGVTAPITPKSGYLSGTTTGSIQSDGNGTAQGSFTIPENIRCGTRVVELSNATNIADTNYISNGIERTYTTTNTDNWHYNYYSDYVYTPSYYTEPSYSEPSYSEPSAPSGHWETTAFTQRSDGSFYAYGQQPGGGSFYSSFSDASNAYGGRVTYDSTYKGQEIFNATRWVTDPVAQSFSSTKSFVMSGLNLYFASVPTSNLAKANIRVEIRPMNSGFPDTQVLSVGTLSPNDVQASSTGTVATKVALKSPIYIQKGVSYAIAVITSSDAYSLYQATIGDNDLSTGQVVSSPAYIGGTLFESRNAETWSTDINTSLKFDVLADTFVSQGIETFQPITIDGNYFTDLNGNNVNDVNGNPIPLLLSRVLLLSKYLTPDNTSINFQFRYVLDKQANNVNINSLDWQPFYPNTDVIFREKIRTIQFRIVLNSSSDLTTAPELSLGSTNLIAYESNTSATYLTDNLTANEGFNRMQIKYIGVLPTNGYITPQYSIDGGKTWSDFSKGYVKTTQLSNTVNRYAYDLQLYNQAGGDTTQANQIKLRIDMNKPDEFGDIDTMALSGTLSLQDGNESGNQGWTAVPTYDKVIPGIVLWNGDGTNLNPSITVAHNFSNLQSGIQIKLVNKLGDAISVIIPNASLVTGTAYNLQIANDSAGTITKNSDTTATFAGLTSYYPVEVSSALIS